MDSKVICTGVHPETSESDTLGLGTSHVNSFFFFFLRWFWPVFLDQKNYKPIFLKSGSLIVRITWNLKTWLPGLYPTLSWSESLEMGPQNMCCCKPHVWFWVAAKFGDDCLIPHPKQVSTSAPRARLNSPHGAQDPAFNKHPGPFGGEFGQLGTVWTLWGDGAQLLNVELFEVFVLLVQSFVYIFQKGTFTKHHLCTRPCFRT